MNKGSQQCSMTEYVDVNMGFGQVYAIKVMWDYSPVGSPPTAETVNKYCIGLQLKASVLSARPVKILFRRQTF